MTKTRKDFATEEEYGKYREKRNKSERERRGKIRPKINKQEKERLDANGGIKRTAYNKSLRKHNRKYKIEVMEHYSYGEPHCLHCGETEIIFLTIDHIKGRASVGHNKSHKGWVLYRWLKNHDYPNGFQVLCWNWNQIKTKKENEINRSMTPAAVRSRNFNLNDKVEALAKYSKYQKPKCNCCGYDELDGLTIDHIEGRRNIKQDENKHGDKLYRLLRQKGYPKGFSTLCFNCNAAKAESAKCPHEK